MPLLNRRERESDEAFTLIELLIVVVIIGILAVIALPIFLSQARLAALASVKSDIRNSEPSLLDGSGTSFSNTSSARMVQSKGNTTGLMFITSGQQQVACIYGYHTFSSTDLVYYHYTSDTGVITDGGCPGGPGGTALANTTPTTSPSNASAAPPASSTPPLADNPALYTVSTSYSDGSNANWACLNIDVVTSQSSDAIWHTDIQLHDYFVQFESNPIYIKPGLQYTDTGPFKYHVNVGGAASYVSAANPVHLKQVFCVDAKGATWMANRSPATNASQF